MIEIDVMRMKITNNRIGSFVILNCHTFVFRSIVISYLVMKRQSNQILRKFDISGSYNSRNGFHSTSDGRARSRAEKYAMLT